MAEVRIKKLAKMDATLCTRCNQCLMACSLAKFNTIDISKSYVHLIGGSDDVSKIKLSKGCDMCGDCFDACYYDAMTLTLKEVIKK